MEAPLLSISAGDLGMNPRSVQNQLSEAFLTAKAWKAVLLLDEADVFMERRTTENLARNELVSSKYTKVKIYMKNGSLILSLSPKA